ncbi:MAG: AAA family ATPase [Acidobacteriia bacterium]|nr:AAA family ATPase [Terriglobia bacterium]
MDEAKRSFVDDPNFLSSLIELERGLGPDQAPAEEAPSLLPQPVAPPPRRNVAAPSPVFPDAFLETDAPPQLEAPPTPRRRATDVDFEVPPIPQRRSTDVGGGRRPLLDLFPAAVESPRPAGARPPGPLLGTAPGPLIAAGVAEVRVPRVEPSAPAVGQPKASAPPAPAEAPTYEAFYGLHEAPFDASADPKFFYHSTSHDPVAQELLTAVRRRDGCVLVTGDQGVGKTTICRVVVDQLDRRTLTSLLLEPCGSIDDVLRTVLVDFGVIARHDAGTPATQEKLTAALASFLVSLAPLQASAVVVIDDAQSLPVEVLAELPSLASAGPLQLVLVGERRLTRLLKRPELRALNQQIAVRCHVDPLPADEILGYIMHRLAIAGTSPRVDFDDAAVARIHELTGGVPRLVNLLCDCVLVRGCEASASVIDARLVNLAAETLDLEPPAADRRGAGRRLMAGLVFAALVLVGAIGALWVNRASVGRAIAQWEQVPPAPRAPARRGPAPLTPLPPPGAGAPVAPATDPSI